MGRLARSTRARAFAPGHLTAFFVPQLSARDPRARGSTGAGLVLDRGVFAEARYSAHGPTTLRLRSSPRLPLPISREVARRLRSGIPGTLEVELRHELPVGQGLGMSAAGAVATGLAVAQVLGVPAQRAWETAHLAELYHRGGLGGVAAIGGGGLEQQVRAGVPPVGKVRHRACSLDLVLLQVGPPVPSPQILGDPRALLRLRREGAKCERNFSSLPSVERFLTESERFTDAAALSPPAMQATIDSVRATGRRVVQAMFGQVLCVITPSITFAPMPALSTRIRRWPVQVGRGGAVTLR
jgi:pantoate kinase